MTRSQAVRHDGVPIGVATKRCPTGPFGERRIGRGRGPVEQPPDLDQKTARRTEGRIRQLSLPREVPAARCRSRPSDRCSTAGLVRA